MRKLFLLLKRSGTWAFTFAIIWTLLIIIACLIPGRDVPDVHLPMIDKWVHFVMFAGFSFLWLCKIKKPTLKKGIIVLFLSILLGYLVELLQGSGITYGRSFDYYDVIADGIGGLIGVLLFFILNRIYGDNDRSLVK